MTQRPATNKQVPDNSILDAFNKQTYLGNQFLYSIPATSTASSSESPILLISNPIVASSGFPSGYQSLFLNFRKVTCITNTQSVLFRFYFNPTVTSVGTPVTPVNLRPANAPASIAAVSTGASVSANGTFLATLPSLTFVPSVSTVLSILDPGQSMLITAQASAASTAIAVEIGWYEL